MPRTRFEEFHCSIAQAAAVVGDAWSLMIVREALFGVTRFGDFEANLGVAKNILTQRLEMLVDAGIMVRTPVTPTARRCEYRLTAKGYDLLPVTVALREWADRWVYGEGKEPLWLVDSRTGKRIPATKLRAANGKPIPWQFIKPAPGPGADKRTRTRFGKA